MSVDVFHDQWLVRTRLAFGTLVDLIPPCSTQVLSLHLHRWRHVPSSLAIDPREMKHILAEVFPPSPWWTRLAGTLRPGGDPRPTLTTSPSGLILRIGSGGRGVTPTDATGWRHRLSLITVGEPERSASQHLVQALGLRD